MLKKYLIISKNNKNNLILSLIIFSVLCYTLFYIVLYFRYQSIKIYNQAKIANSIPEDQIVQDLYQMLKDTTEILKNANITYAAYAGTILGSVRHQGLIPWDDDIDLVIFYHDAPKLKKLSSIFAKIGYELTYFKDLYKVHKQRKDGLIYPFIDIILIYENKATNNIMYVNKVMRDISPLEIVPKNKFFPLKLYTFGPLQIYGPNDGEWIVEHFYGPDWRTIGIIFPKHPAQNVEKWYKIIKLNDKLRKPILPKSVLLNRVTPDIMVSNPKDKVR